MQPGQLVWIANEAPHAHIADPRTPWTLLWFRLDGPNPAALRQKLFGDGAPRVTLIEGATLASWFDRLFSAVRGREPGLDLRLNHLVGEFLTIVDRRCRGSATPSMPSALAAIVAAMRTDLSRRWSAEELCAVDEPQPLANPAAVSQAFAREPSPMAAARTSHVCAIPHHRERCAAFRGRRSVRILRRLSLQSGIQACGRNIACRLASRRIGGGPSLTPLDRTRCDRERATPEKQVSQSIIGELDRSPFGTERQRLSFDHSPIEGSASPS